MQVQAEVVLDRAIEVLDLSVELRVGRCCFGMLDIQNVEELGQ